MEQNFGVLHKLILLLPYLLVQMITRGGDWAIQNYIIYTYNVNWALPAQAAGAVVNVGLGYVFQKFIVFPDIEGGVTKKIRKPFQTFLVLRACLGVGVFVLLNILFMIWPEQYIFYSGVVTVFMWFYSYKSQRGVFKAKLRDLPRSVRRTREIVLRPKNTRRRIARKLTTVTAPFKT